MANNNVPGLENNFYGTGIDPSKGFQNASDKNRFERARVAYNLAQGGETNQQPSQSKTSPVGSSNYYTNQLSKLQGDIERAGLENESDLEFIEKERTALEERRERAIADIERSAKEETKATKESQRGEVGATSLFLAGAGSAGRTGSSMGVLQKQAAAHRDEIKAIDTKRQQLINQAKSAYESKDFELAKFYKTSADKLRQDRIDLYQRLQDNEIKIAQEARRQSEFETDAYQTELDQQRTRAQDLAVGLVGEDGNVADFGIIQQYADQYGIDPYILLNAAKEYGRNEQDFLLGREQAKLKIEQMNQVQDPNAKLTVKDLMSMAKDMYDKGTFNTLGEAYDEVEKMINEASTDYETTGAFRTDRHNNPTALMWTPGVEKFFKDNGYNVKKGDKFPDSNNYTIDMTEIDDPVKATIDYIDAYTFYYNGKPRWTHTDIPKQVWDNMGYDAKKDVVKEMYRKEVGSGELFEDEVDIPDEEIITNEERVQQEKELKKEEETFEKTLKGIQKKLEIKDDYTWGEAYNSLRFDYPELAKSFEEIAQEEGRDVETVRAEVGAGPEDETPLDIILNKSKYYTK